MKCDRCGKMVDAVFPHSCTPLALKLANQLELRHIGWEDDAAAELRRLQADNAELTENLEKKSVAIQRIWKERDELRNENEALKKQIFELKGNDHEANRE